MIPTVFDFYTPEQREARSWLKNGPLACPHCSGEGGHWEWVQYFITEPPEKKWVSCQKCCTTDNPHGAGIIPDAEDVGFDIMDEYPEALHFLTIWSTKHD